MDEKTEKKETREEKDISKVLTQKHFMVMVVAILLLAAFTMQTRSGLSAQAAAHRIAADMNNIRACTFAYYSDTASWPKSLADIQRQTDIPIKNAVEGISVVDDEGALFVKYDGKETAMITKANDKTAKELVTMRDKDRLFSAPTADAAAKPDYNGGTDVYMMIKTKSYNPSSQF